MKVRELEWEDSDGVSVAYGPFGFYVKEKQ